MKLYAHQERALDWARDRDRIALFMEMRCGKSTVAIQWARARRCRRVLLVSTLMTLPGDLQWEGELARNGVTNVTRLFGVPAEERESRANWTWAIENGRLVRRRAYGWFLANYELIRVCPEIMDAPWDAIIFDESTQLRNPSAAITKTVLRHIDHIPNRAILSGLPNPEDTLDFFTQFQVAFDNFCGFDSYWAFRERRFQTIYTGYDWRPKKGVAAAIKEFVHERSFICTRQEADIGGPKAYAERVVTMNYKQKAAMRQIRKSFKMGERSTVWAPVAHQWMQAIAGGYEMTEDGSATRISDDKLELTADLLGGEFRDQPIVIWSQYNHEIDDIVRYLQAKTFRKVAGITGTSVPKVDDRQKLQAAFHAGKLSVLVMQIALGKFGWNLSCADTAIYYSSTYEFEARNQSEDRIIHPAKKTPCLIVDLVTADSTDEDVRAARKDKKFTSKMMLRKLDLRLIGDQGRLF